VPSGIQENNFEAFLKQRATAIDDEFRRIASLPNATATASASAFASVVVPATDSGQAKLA
jgi:hypothetical protein